MRKLNLKKKIMKINLGTGKNTERSVNLSHQLCNRVDTYVFKLEARQFNAYSSPNYKFHRSDKSFKFCKKYFSGRIRDLAAKREREREVAAQKTELPLNLSRAPNCESKKYANCYPSEENFPWI